MSKKDTTNSKNKIAVEKLPEAEVKLSIVVPAEKLEQAIEKVSNAHGSEMKVDGFRKGKIPKDIIEKTIGGEKLLYEAAEELVKEAYINAVLDEKIEAIGEPKIEITKIAKGNDLEFTAIVGVLPEISLAGWEPGAKKVNEKFKDEKIEVKGEEVDKEIEFLANQRAAVVTVSREAKKGDQVEVDFVVSQGGVPIENGTAKKHQIIIGEGKFIPGFEEQVIGMKAGEEKKFDLKFPEEYNAKHLAGKEATFEVKANLVQERKNPEINDEFAAGIGKFKNLKELKENIHQGLEHEKKHKLEDKQKMELIDVVIEKMELDIPSVLIEKEMETMMAELEADISRIGLNKQQYLEQIKMTEEKLKEGWQKDQAPKRVKAALAIREIAKSNEISPDAKEIEAEVNKVMEYYQSMGQMEDKIDVQRLYEATKANLTNEKVFQHLMKI